MERLLSDGAMSGMSAIGTKPTCGGALQMPAYDPKRTLGAASNLPV
jgi:hypothetical protein